jgi:hypothetical protein
MDGRGRGSRRAETASCLVASLRSAGGDRNCAVQPNRCPPRGIASAVQYAAGDGRMHAGPSAEDEHAQESNHGKEKLYFQ